MNDLPTPASPGNNPISTNNPIIQSNTALVMQGAGGVHGKETEVGRSASELPLRETGSIEMELPKEVSAVGVKVQPASVTIPQPVQQMGVTATGTNVPLGTGAAVALPLTDEQIAQGLHQGITSSWRWLAEWCIRRLKQVHVGIKYVHGKLFRTNSS